MATNAMATGAVMFVVGIVVAVLSLVVGTASIMFGMAKSVSLFTQPEAPSDSVTTESRPFGFIRKILAASLGAAIFFSGGSVFAFVGLVIFIFDFAQRLLAK